MIKQIWFLFLFGVTSVYSQVNNDSGWYQLHFQQTVVTQYHPNFSAAYTGPNSMVPHEEAQTSLTTTFYAGFKLSHNTAIYFNPEIAGGAGLSKAMGVAGFPNGETFRVGNPAPQVYIARLYLSQYIPLSKERVKQDDAFNQLNGTIPKKYIRLIAGRFAISDFFDCNSYSHDPRTQFLNWALMSNGGYDYAANTRGYTYGGIIEMGLEKWSFRFGATMVPTEANKSTMDGNISQAHALQAEAEYRWLSNTGVVRLLVFQNAAHMGNYDQAVNEAIVGGYTPSIVDTRSYGRKKSGVGINIEQKISDKLGVFGRASYNDGKNETWMFTEIDHSISLGILGNHPFKSRPSDTWGISALTNGISAHHQNYLAHGGTGFMIGDGQLNYAPEMILELFYNADLHDNHFYITPDYQFVLNPAYNADRGPIHILGLRVHTRF